VPCARLHTRQVLWEWRHAGLSEAAELVVSELVTNAVTATTAIGSLCPVRLWLLADRAHLLIVAADASPRPPQQAEPAGKAEGGRGLLLVEALSSRWGWHAITSRGMAKVVWAELTAHESCPVLGGQGMNPRGGAVEL